MSADCILHWKQQNTCNVCHVESLFNLYLLLHFECHKSYEAFCSLLPSSGSQ